METQIHALKIRKQKALLKLFQRAFVLVKMKGLIDGYNCYFQD